jgi:MFS transporter, ACS family, hexuronate transporter
MVVALVGYDPLFVALTCFDLVGALVVWFVLKEPGTPQLRNSESVPHVAEAVRA